MTEKNLLQKLTGVISLIGDSQVMMILISLMIHQMLLTLFKRQDNYQVNYNIDDIFYNTGYLPCHLIQNWKTYTKNYFTEEEYDPDDNEIDPPSVHVEWTTETTEEE